jgi:hypothetical protein
MHAYHFMNPLTIAASNLPKLTTGIGALAWLGFILATAGLFLFYRCSRYMLTLSFLDFHFVYLLKVAMSALCCYLIISIVYLWLFTMHKFLIFHLTVAD